MAKTLSPRSESEKADQHDEEKLNEILEFIHKSRVL